MERIHWSGRQSWEVLFCEICGQKVRVGSNCRSLGFRSPRISGCMKQEKWIAALRHDALTGIIKLQKVPPKRADSQARSRSFWFLVVEVSLGLKQLAGLSRGKGWMVSGMFCWACYVLENKWRNEPVSVAGGCPCKKEEKVMAVGGVFFSECCALL